MSEVRTDDDLAESDVPTPAGPAAGRTPRSPALRRAVEGYRSLHELPGGPFPQVQGLLDDNVVAALQDDRTIVAEIKATQGPLPLPLLTPIDQVSWYSPEFRRSAFTWETERGLPAWHLSTYPGLGDEQYLMLLRSAVEELRRQCPDGCLVFADHAERADDPSGERLSELLRRSGLSASEVPIVVDQPAREHYFAGRATLGEPGRRLHPIDLRTIVTGPTTDQGFIDELWAIYEPPFRRLAEKTPLRTYFERDELGEALSRPGVMQTFHRDNDRLVSWMMMTTDIGSFPWMDPDAIYAAAPGLAADRVRVFPGLVTDESYRGQHLLDRLVHELTYALTQLGHDHLIVFETLDENAEFLPGLISNACDDSGYGRIEFRQIGAQAHRVWRCA